MPKSLRWRIILPFSGLILLAVLLSGYLAVQITREQFDLLVTDDSRRQAAALAAFLETQINNGASAGSSESETSLRVIVPGRGTVPVTPAAPLQPSIVSTSATQSVIKTQPATKTQPAEQTSRFLNTIPVNGRIFITDAAGLILYDSQGGRTGTTLAAKLLYQGTAVYDYATSGVIGHVVVAVGEGFYGEQSLGVGWWLARRITAPVTAVTVAATRLAQSGSTERLPAYATNELGQMSAAFNQMADALETQQMLRRRLISDLSHELRTPLSIIELELEGLEDNLQTTTEAASHVRRELELLDRLSQDLHFLVQSDVGELQLEPEPIDYAAWLTSEVARWQNQADAARVALVLMPLPTDLPILSIDPARMSQAIGNLLRNALQHTEANGRITVTGQVESETRAVITSIADTGEGITAEDLPYVFERFYRADVARQRETGGRGLGLSIVKQIVEAHHGEVWVESQAGQGTTFSFRLCPTA
jgi:two-component system sensor histidine kinase BaeS